MYTALFLSFSTVSTSGACCPSIVAAITPTVIDVLPATTGSAKARPPIAIPITKCVAESKRTTPLSKEEKGFASLRRNNREILNFLII